jgi:PAS domain S-box-containing protein
MKTKTILVVEDEIIIGLNEKSILERNGYDVLLAHSGSAAVESATATDAVDLVLMDIDLGRGMDGTEAARAILKHREIPIVFLSSHTEPDVVAKTEQISSYGYVVKDSGETVLLASIRMAFRLYEANRTQQETNGYLRTVLETVPNGFWVLDGTGTIRDMNRKYCDMSGYTREELTGTHIGEIDVIDDIPDVTRRIRHLLAGGTERFRTHHRKKNGTVFPVAVTASHIPGTDPPRLISFVRDLSREDRLYRDTFYTALLDAVPGAVYQFQMFPDGSSCFPFASRGIELVYEVTPEEVRDDAAPAFRRLHPEDHDTVAASIRRSMETLTIWQQDYRVVLPGRGERWVRGQARPEKHDDGSVLWYGYISDITDIYIQHRKTEEQTRRLQNVLDGTNVGTWEWNVQTSETVFNERWASMLGYTLDELSPTSIETTWTGLLHPDDAAGAERALQRHFAGEKEFYECEMRMRHKSGEWVWILDRGKVFARTETGDPLWVYGTHQDITERVGAQQTMAQSVENEKILMAELNHRVKNNLAMVGSMIRLKDAELGETTDLSDIQSRVDAITSLHEELQHAGGVGDIALDSYLQRVIQHVVANNSNPVRVVMDLQALRIPTKIAVPVGLIVNELVTNAVKYGFAGDATAELVVRQYAEAGSGTGPGTGSGQCVIEVTNSGNPFPEGITLENHTTMGLRLVVMLVGQISGTVTLDRTPQTTFTIRFPLEGF